MRILPLLITVEVSACMPSSPDFSLNVPFSIVTLELECMESSEVSAVTVALLIFISPPALRPFALAVSSSAAEELSCPHLPHCGLSLPLEVFEEFSLPPPVLRVNSPFSIVRVVSA